MSSDVVTKLLSAKPYKSGGAQVWVNEITGTSGRNEPWVEEWATMSGTESWLADYFDDINYYAGASGSV